MPIINFRLILTLDRLVRLVMTLIRGAASIGTRRLIWESRDLMQDSLRVQNYLAPVMNN